MAIDLAQCLKGSWTFAVLLVQGGDKGLAIWSGSIVSTLCNELDCFFLNIDEYCCSLSLSLTSEGSHGSDASTPESADASPGEEMRF
jgi:hypothetical protein